MPNVYHLPICFFPQYSSKSEFKRRDGSAVFFRDKLLDAASEKGWSYRKTVHDYWDCKHFKKEELDDKLMKFLKKVEEREKEWDIKCLEFIKENYQKNQLFYDPNHPTNFFLKYISEEILKELEISFDRKEWDKINPHSLTGYQMPILPEVKENFKMVFKENDEFRKDSYCKVRLGKMGGGDDYIKQYLACTWQNEDVKKVSYRLKWRFVYYCMKVYNRFFKLFHSMC